MYTFGGLVVLGCWVILVDLSGIQWSSPAATPRIMAWPPVANTSIANTYSDVMTYDLVDAASRVLEMPADELTSAKESGGRRVRPGDRGTTHPSSSLAVGDAIR